MADFTIKVSPDEMIRQADNIKDSVEKIRKQFANIEELVNRSSAFWEGEASDLHIKKYRDLKQDCDEISRRLGEHPDDLLKMAGIYSESETRSTEDSNSLQSNIFS